MNKFVNKNKFGGYTWLIKIDSLFHIYIDSTPENTYIVSFKEWKWINYKTHFSFVSNQVLPKTIKESFERVYIYFQNHGDYIWTDKQKNIKLHQTLNLLDDPDDENHKAEKAKNAFFASLAVPQTATSPKVSIRRGVGIDGNIINITTAQMIVEKYGHFERKLNYNNYSIGIEYPNSGISFYYKYDDPNKVIFSMMATGEKLYETETGLIFDENLTIDKVVNHYGEGISKTNAKGEGVIGYYGIIFHFTVNEMEYLDYDEIKVTKIAVM